MNVPVVSHLKLLVNLYNKMNNRFLVLLVIYLIIYLLSVLYKNKQIFCAILLSLLSWERGCSNLKCLVSDGIYCVAPLVGAWMLEMPMCLMAVAEVSLLSWERGCSIFLQCIQFISPGRSSRGSVDARSRLPDITCIPKRSLLSWERGCSKTY